MTEEERPYMVGHRCESLERPIRGSTKHACIECRRLVYITPASLRIVGEQRCVIVCSTCASESLPEQDIEVQPLSKEQQKEFDEDG